LTIVAIGDPKDTLAPRCARDYVPDDAWQELVTLRLKRSQLVVLLAGATPGLAWEVEQCRKLLDPAKLFVVVPANAAAYEKFAQLCEERGVRLPAFASFEHDRGPIAGLVSFDAHWEPHAHRFARITVLDPSFLHQEEEALAALAHRSEFAGLPHRKPATIFAPPARSRRCGPGRRHSQPASISRSGEH
jgi:hypothetical protein